VYRFNRFIPSRVGSLWHGNLNFVQENSDPGSKSTGISNIAKEAGADIKGMNPVAFVKTHTYSTTHIVNTICVCMYAFSPRRNYPFDPSDSSNNKTYNNNLYLEETNTLNIKHVQFTIIFTNYLILSRKKII
jgi:hypothetical protein